jgi:hypothetical protein
MLLSDPLTFEAERYRILQACGPGVPFAPPRTMVCTRLGCGLPLQHHAIQSEIIVSMPDEPAARPDQTSRSFCGRHDAAFAHCLMVS